MIQVLMATDADWLFEEVSEALTGPGTVVSRVRDGRDVAEAANHLKPSLVVLDLQTGTQGGIATAIDLRHDIDMGRTDPTKILLLLDRDADRWLARQANADGWLVKPLDALRLRRAARACVTGDGYFDGDPAPAEAQNSQGPKDQDVADQ